MKNFSRFLIVVSTFFLAVMELICLADILANGIMYFLQYYNITNLAIFFICLVSVKSISVIIYFIEKEN